MRSFVTLALISILSGATCLRSAQLTFESFDADPGWDGHNNRNTTPEPRRIRQDFGYSRTSHTGGPPGEIGGYISPAGEPAYYVLPLSPSSFDKPLTASGTLAVGSRENGGGNTLIGFFNTNTVNEWRTANSIAIRVYGRGDGFHCHLEYATSKWRAGADSFNSVEPDTSKQVTRLIPSGEIPHTWTLTYDPRANQGGGAIRLSLDGETLLVNLDPGHKADGAQFNAFGILNVVKSADGGGTLWLNQLAVNGTPHPLDHDPGWLGFQNRRTYISANVRPRFDFGYSPTHHAGGAAKGELGGLVFRGDQRFPDRMGYYGAPLTDLTLNHPLQIEGKLALHRGVTDSTVLLGYFHHTDSMRTGPEQASGFPENFLGAVIEGPSREGFLFYPAYSTSHESTGAQGSGSDAPHILPDGTPHDFSVRYDPTALDGHGQLTVALDNASVSLPIANEHRRLGARFDRFGIVTTHIDGNGQLVYFDDLSFTSAPQPSVPGRNPPPKR